MLTKSLQQKKKKKSSRLSIGEDHCYWCLGSCKSLVRNPLELYKATELCVSGCDSRFSGWRVKNGMLGGSNITIWTWRSSKMSPTLVNTAIISILRFSKTCSTRPDNWVGNCRHCVISVLTQLLKFHPSDTCRNCSTLNLVGSVHSR